MKVTERALQAAPVEADLRAEAARPEASAARPGTGFEGLPRPGGDVAILTFPSNARNPAGDYERRAFSQAQQNIWNRMARKPAANLDESDRFANRPKRIGETPLVFHSFTEVGGYLRQEDRWIAKLYVQAHGEPEAVIDSSGKKLSAAVFSENLFSAGGLDERLFKPLPFTCGQLKLRSLACQTGRRPSGGRDTLSWIEQVQGHLETRVMHVRRQAEGGADPALQVATVAPRAWQFTWNDGKNVVYEKGNRKNAAYLETVAIPKAMATQTFWNHKKPTPSIADAIVPRNVSYTTASTWIGSEK